MTPTTAPTGPSGKSIVLPLLAGVILAIGLGGGAFWVTFSGMLGSDSPGTAVQRDQSAPTSYSYIALDPITINLGSRGATRHLRVSLQIEVLPPHAAEVSRQVPRILDVLNVYLRALSMDELEEPAALIRLRAQMLRRVQIVTGPGRVNDLLVTEFLFN